MIVVDVSLDGEGRLRTCRVEGHAGAGRRGDDPVCAAVSVLVRTAARTLAAAEGISVNAEVERCGSLALTVSVSPTGETFLAAATAFLLQGLNSVAEDYPRFCTVRIERERRIQHGSQEGR